MALKKNKINPNAGLASSEIMKQAEIITRVDDAIKDIAAIPRNLIAPHENNDYRELDSEETIAQLADAIKRQGLLDNLVIVKRQSRTPGQEDKKYVLLSGERRFRAINMLCENDADMASKYATIPCNVIPDEFFALPSEAMERLHGAGYDDDKIREIQELIIIDEANLQRRGGVGDEIMQRKATYRYSTNLTIIYGISEENADEITKQICGQNVRTTIRNLKIERSLVSSLKDLLDKGFIKKPDAEKLGSMDIQTQETIGAALTGLSDVLNATAESIPPEITGAKNALSDALTVRNKIKQDEAINKVCADALKKTEEIRAARVPKPKKNIASDAADKYMSRLTAIRTKVDNLGKTHSVKQIVSLGLDEGENSIYSEIDRTIASLQEFRAKVEAESQKKNK